MQYSQAHVDGLKDRLRERDETIQERNQSILTLKEEVFRLKREVAQLKGDDQGEWGVVFEQAREDHRVARMVVDHPLPAIEKPSNWVDPVEWGTRHAYPKGGCGELPCCGNHSRDLPHNELITTIPERVTCLGGDTV